MSELDIIVDKPPISNIDGDVIEHTDLEVVSLAERANRIRQLTADVTQGFIDIGFELIAAKKEIGHGNWTEWLKSEFNWSIRTAQNFMALAERFGNTKTFSFLPTSTLIKMLALPEGDEEKFVEKQVENGRPIEKQSAREIQKSVKEWNQNKATQTPVIETSFINEETTTPETSESNNDTAIDSESTDSNNQEESTNGIDINSLEKETKNILTTVYFQVPQIQALWSLIEETPDLHKLKVIHVELSKVMYDLQEKMEELHNANT